MVALLQQPFYLGVGKDEQPILPACAAEGVLPAAIAGGRDAHTLHRRAPPGAGDHAPPMRAEADEHHLFLTPPLPGELPHVDQSVVSHVREAGVAHVGVMLPDYRLRIRTVMAEQPPQGLSHVPISNVPRGSAALDHGPIVPFGVPRHERVLFGSELGLASVLGMLRSPAKELGEHRHDLVLAGGWDEGSGLGVLSGAPTVGLETLVGPLRGLHSVRVLPLQVLHYRVQRLPQAVDVEAVEADARGLRKPVVVAAEPLNELDNLFVRPHPRWPPAKGSEGFSWAVRGSGKALNLAVYLVAVRPVAFDRDKGEVLLADQALAYAGAFTGFAGKIWSRQADSNRFPAHYECAARPLGATDRLTNRTAASSV